MLPAETIGDVRHPRYMPYIHDVVGEYAITPTCMGSCQLVAEEDVS